jgi:very-short-patch-repair endonuclease
MVEGERAMTAPNTTIALARGLRRTLSPPEARLWVRLRNRTAEFPAFRRQHPMGPYVLDFYCARAGLAVEVDGWSHGVGDRPTRDARRDAWLVGQGVHVLRIEAAEVMRDPDGVADGVMRHAAELAADPHHRASRGPPPP